jgi:O-antigen/teichoic acid export membrane protein
MLGVPGEATKRRHCTSGAEWKDTGGHDRGARVYGAARWGTDRVKARLRRLQQAATTGDGLRHRAIRSSFWTLAEYGGSQIFRLASNLILTRILFPEAFGLMALVTVVVIGLAMLSDAGLQPSIVQSARAGDRHFLNTAWTVQVIRGVLLSLAVWALAPLAAAFYEQPQLALMLPVAGLSMAISGLAPTKLHVAARNMALGRTTIVRLVAQLVGILAMIALALATDSVWSLVIGGVLGTAVKIALFHAVLPGERDRFGWDPRAWTELFHFGKWILLSSLAGFLIGQGDRMVLGKYLSAYDLGIYSIGFFLASVPNMLAQRIGQYTIFPVARERDPAASVKNFMDLRRARALSTGAILAMTTVFMLVGPWMVRTLYDDRYLGAQSVLLLLALAQIPQIVLAPYAKIALARGAARDQMWYSFAQAFGQMALMLLALEYMGLGAALLAPAAAALLALPLSRAIAKRHGAWDPGLDFMLGAVGTGSALLALWLNADVLVLIDAFALR